MTVNILTACMPTKFHLTPQMKWAFTTRRVVRGDAVRLNGDVKAAVSGDVVLGRIERIGSHKNLQLAEGRPSELYEGDLVVAVCGARYAPDQFEGLDDIDPDGADMLASGGVLGRMRQHHQRMVAPTRVVPIGLLADRDGRTINLQSYALPPAPRPGGITVIGVVGATMNSGKTTTTASLAHGLQRAGHRVAAIKGTGTGAYGDFNAFRDAGAAFVADFTDVGMVSTYLQPIPRIAAGLDTMLAAAAREGCEVAVVELADGVLQAETAALLRDAAVRSMFAGFLFAASDALAGAGGCRALREVGIEPAALSGMLSCSPLGAAEAHAATGIRVLTRGELRDPAIATALLLQFDPVVCNRVAA